MRPLYKEARQCTARWLRDEWMRRWRDEDDGARADVSKPIIPHVIGDAEVWMEIVNEVGRGGRVTMRSELEKKAPTTGSREPHREEGRDATPHTRTAPRTRHMAPHIDPTDRVR